MFRLERQRTQRGIFPKEAFFYDADNDVFICPDGKTLRRRKYFKKRKHYEYIASANTCKNCQLKEKCTRAKFGRTLKRHVRHDDLDFMLTQANNRNAKKDIRTRQHLMERSFARGTRKGYKRARWRRLWRVQIQECVTSTLQNIMIIVQHIKEPAPAQGMVLAKPDYPKAYIRVQELFFVFKEVMTNSINYLFEFRCSESQNLAEKF